ncbi:MAG: hypothetical protein Q8K58_10835 [Acidimicrobiales bacterium]|nr:hypothetical protein [Acidimicrobiales bacterium]
MCIDLRLDVSDPRANSVNYFHALEVLRDRTYDDPTFLLDLVELLLSTSVAESDRRRLEGLLVLGNSIYTIADGGRGLAYRVLPSVKAVVEAAVSSAGGSASEHLADAWNLAYGRSGDPVKAYSEAVKAVEAAAIPVVQPRNARATLGTVLGELSSGAGWQFVLGGAAGMDRVVGMGRLLWEGQTSRHGGTAPTRAETIDEARTAVHLAATLVQFFVMGAVEA